MPFDYPISPTLGAPIGSPFNPPYLTSIDRPPCYPNVLTWHPGTVLSGTYFKDSSTKLGVYPLLMSKGPCLTFNGVDEYGIIQQAITYTTPATSYIRVKVSHHTASSFKAFQVIFGQDNNKGLFVNQSSTGILNLYVGGVSISSVAGTIATDTTYEIEAIYDNGDMTLLVDGAVVKTGTSTMLEDPTKMYIGKGSVSALGSVNGGKYCYIEMEFGDTSETTQLIELPCIGKTATLNPSSIYATDGTEMTLTSSDLPTLWAGTQDLYFYEITRGFWEDVNGRYPYAHSGAERVYKGWNNPMNSFSFSEAESAAPAAIVTMDTDNFFTTTSGKSLIITQTTIEELGGELQTNNYFTADLSGYTTTTNWAWESPGVCRHSIGSTVSLTSDITLTSGIEYEVAFTSGGTISGTVTPYTGSGGNGTARGNGIFTERLTCSGSTDFMLTPTTDFDGWVDDVSVREVDPLVNYNDKYMFGSVGTKPKEFWCYATVQSGTCLTKSLIRAGV